MMCQSMEDRIKAETAAASAAQAIEIALRMIARGKMSLEDIAECCDLSLDEVKALAEKNRAAAT